MRNTIFLKFILLALLISSCSNDDDTVLADFAVSFNAATIGTTETDTAVDVRLLFSRAATEAGTIVLSYTDENTVYGTDYTTTPSGESGTISIPVAVGDTDASFTFNKLTNAIEGIDKSVTFSFDSFGVSFWLEGANTNALVSFASVVSPGATVDVEIGGSTQPNRVYFDLSSGQFKTVRRDTWDIAVYNGTENKVYLNSSLLVSAAELEGITDITSVTESTTLTSPLTLNTLDSTFTPTTVTVNTVAELMQGLSVSYPQYGNLANDIIFTDSSDGELSGTAFSEISTNESENNVYIVSLGSLWS